MLGLIAVAVPLGMAHALDADHVLAVSALTATKGRVGASRGGAYAVRWAIGHGGLLMLVAAASLCLHFVLPATLPFWAERFVGVILVVTGALAILKLTKDRRGAIEHRHDGFSHTHGRVGGRRHDHSPTLVGMVHGLAGSAPALALIPATLLHPALGLAYVLTFSLGVLAGMLAFGLCLRIFQQALLKRAPLIADIARGALGALAILIGAIWFAARWSS